jgi:hypothetical protein
VLLETCTSRGATTRATAVRRALRSSGRAYAAAGPEHGQAGLPSYESEFRASVQDPEGYWASKAENIHWHKRYNPLFIYFMNSFNIHFAKKDLININNNSTRL